MIYFFKKTIVQLYSLMGEETGIYFADSTTMKGYHNSGIWRTLRRLKREKKTKLYKERDENKRLAFVEKIASIPKDYLFSINTKFFCFSYCFDAWRVNQTVAWQHITPPFSPYLIL